MIILKNMVLIMLLEDKIIKNYRQYLSIVFDYRRKKVHSGQ
jgi:hypothetical protein